MDEPPAIDVVYGALNALYHNPDPACKERASQFLNELQRSIHAWKIADQLLHVKKDMESCYFGAQTLRTKIQFAFHELPTEAHSSLRDSMLAHLKQINEHTNTVIVTQLCLALADLLLQMTTWTSPIQDLIQILGPKNNFENNHLWPLLEVLTVLPEELGSRTLRLGANRRSELMKLFSNAAENVLRLLDSCLNVQTSDRLIGARMLRCFASWVTLQPVTLHQLTSCATLGHVFTLLSHPNTPPQVHDAASDAVCALLQVVADHENDDDAHNGIATHALVQLRTLEDSLIHSIKNLETAYHIAVANEDMDKCINYSRIFTEIAEALLHRMIESTKNNNGSTNATNLFGLLDLVLTCVGYHDYEVAEVTFGFWYKLSEDLYHVNDDQRTMKFKPYIERLIGAVCRHCQMEPDHEGVLEDGDDFAGFRSRVSELVKDVVFIVGSASVFRHCFYSIHGHNNLPWEVTEAALFIMQAVAKNILPEENEVVPSVVEALLQVPECAHAAVRFTTLLLLGELGEWLEKHPNFVEPVLHTILRSINDPALSLAACNSLEAICSICREHLKSRVDVLLQVSVALVTLSIPSETAVRVVKGVTSVCCKLSNEQAVDALHKLCKVHVDELTRISQSSDNGSKITPKSSSDPVYWLDRLASVFRHVNIKANKSEQHPCLTVVSSVWPSLSLTLDKFQTDRRVMERCCRCLRFALRLIGRHSAPLLDSLVTQMIRLYTAHHHSCFLYLASILVDEFGTLDGCVGGLITMMESMLPRAFQLLQEHDGLRNNPDTVDDLFRLFARFLQRNPAAFLQSQALVGIFDCALMASVLDHRDANASVMQFLVELIHVSKASEDKIPKEIKDQLISGVLHPKGPLLISTLVTAGLFSLPSSSVTNVAEVLIEFMAIDRQSISRWMDETLQSIPRQSPSGCLAVTDEQLQEFRRKIVASSSSQELSGVLRDLSRMYR